jgi:hypothetical protein
VGFIRWRFAARDGTVILKACICLISLKRSEYERDKF